PLTRSNETNWVALVFIVTYHVALLIALPLYLLNVSPSGALFGWTGFLVVASLLAITTGYHRLYSHVTYKTRKPVEAVLLFFGTMTAQGSVFEWAHDHRLHHNHVDTDRDPYGTPQGFWYSHLLWMFKKRQPFDERYLRDLRKNELLVFQDRYYVWLMAATN